MKPNGDVTNKSTTIWVALAVAIAVGLGSGYALGESTAASDADAARAKAEAESLARSKAYGETFKSAQAKGKRIGVRRGRAAGKRQGEAAAKRELAKRTQAAQQKQASQQSACPSGQQLLHKMDTTYCGRPGPARPEDCPPGWVPAGETGACAPKD